MFSKYHHFARGWLTARVTCGWAGVDKTPRAGFCSGVEKARKWRGIPPVKCTLCWAAGFTMLIILQNHFLFIHSD